MDDIRRILEENIENYEEEYQKLELNVWEQDDGAKEREWYANYLKGSVKEKQILFWCKGFLSCADIPRYIFDYLYQTYGDEYRYLWVVKSKKKIPEGLPEGVVFIQCESRAFWRALAESKYLIGNVLLPVNFIKRKEQVYLNSLLGLDSLYKTRNAVSLNINSLILTEMLKTDYLLADSEWMLKQLYEDRYQLRELYQGKIICMDSIRAAYMKSREKVQNDVAKCVFLIRNKVTYQWFADNWEELKSTEMECRLVRDQNCYFEGNDICDIIADSDLIISDRSNYLRDAEAYGCKIGCWKHSEDFIGFENYEVIENADALKEYLEKNKGFRRNEVVIDEDSIKRLVEFLLNHTTEIETRSLMFESAKKKLLFLTDWRIPREERIAVRRMLESVDTDQYDITAAAISSSDISVQDEIKQFSKQMRILFYRGKMVLTKEEFIFFRLIERNPYLLYEYKQVYEFALELMQREWLRKWGNITCDCIILLGDKVRQYMITVTCKGVQKVLAAEKPLAELKLKDKEQWQKLWVDFDKIYVSAFASEATMEEYGKSNSEKVEKQQLFYNEESTPVEEAELNGERYIITDRWRILPEREMVSVVKLPKQGSCIVNLTLPFDVERSEKIRKYLTDKKFVLLMGECVEEYKDIISCEYEELDEYVYKRLYMLPTAESFFGKVSGYWSDIVSGYDAMEEICKKYNVAIHK